MAVKALAKNVRISPRKVGVVASLVRNRTVDDALNILEFTPKKAAIAIKKTILSARANATNNHNYLSKDLRITEISVTPGSKTLKRVRPVARGQAHQFKHRYSHILVFVDGQKREVKNNKQTTKKDK
ncbi:MAG: 50S ribosomal protein L22 [Patescibacteria group bacterium]|jgi:large subunit ribosomal protein L22|nr:50S ribosomal protein L22 [Patescibacteria group bacterium]